QVVEVVAAARPGYLPEELGERLRSASSSGSLTPASEALELPALQLLAALLLPPRELEAVLAGALGETRSRLAAGPAYRGRPERLSRLDSGLRVLAAGARRAAASARFRAAHLREVLQLQGELQRREEQQQQRGEAGGVQRGAEDR
ncbi:hypothetical protein Agub_g7734, partial [Astrephomene gubernaculifera]